MEIEKILNECSAIHLGQNDLYKNASNDIKECLKSVFNDDLILEIHHRVKTVKSLKEKIIRRKLYKQFENSKMIMDSVQDLVGVMIECRFVSDEELVFEKLKEIFNVKMDNGTSRLMENENIYLYLDASQPQPQKNGISLYRIDGVYEKAGQKLNFELQIKSLVNKFWSEIEHSVVYKNNIYLPENDFIVKMLGTIRNNLLGIDTMLLLVKEQIERMNEPVTERLNIKVLISKLISDLINDKMNDSMGFITNTKTISDLLCVIIMQEMNFTSDEDFQIALAVLSEKIEQGKNLQIDINCNLEFDKTLFNKYENFIQTINTDFEWHIFFIFYDYFIDGDINEKISRIINLLTSNNLMEGASFKEISEVFYENINF